MTTSESRNACGSPARGKIRKDTFPYSRVFMYSSLQFCGHIEEYFVGRTVDLLVYIVQPRVGEHSNFIRRYHAGVLVEERGVRSSQNVFLYYLLWYLTHIRLLLGFSRGEEGTLVIGWHPLVFFGMRVLKCLRPLSFMYWIGDYFPSKHFVIRLYEQCKKAYQRHVDYVYYLSDAINGVMNGLVVDLPRRRTVMWGLKPQPVAPVPTLEPFSLLFVGLIRPGQGLESLFDFLAAHNEYRLELIGVGKGAYVRELQSRLSDLHLKDRVFFPNRFYSEDELLSVAKSCHVGIALYDMNADNFTHYADPGKVKAYAEMHLPVLMTRISCVVTYVEKFGSGEVIDRFEQVGEALERIRSNYAVYQSGVGRFIRYFAFDRYYDEAFDVLKECWE